jgi:hypothetical protein
LPGRHPERHAGDIVSADVGLGLPDLGAGHLPAASGRSRRTRQYSGIVLIQTINPDTTRAAAAGLPGFTKKKSTFAEH